MLFGDLHPGRGDALLAINLQNDFLPGGSVGIREGDAVIRRMNDYIHVFESQDLPVYAIRDWHPADHCSFEEQGGPWPSNCVADTPGADFAPLLSLPEAEKIVVISKGTDKNQLGYSAFEGADLAERLHSEGVKRVFVGGLATEYSVRHTVQDALDRGFKVVLLEDAIRGVNREPEDAGQALADMRRKGAKSATLNEIK